MFLSCKSYFWSEIQEKASVYNNIVSFSAKKALVLTHNLFWHFLAFWAGPGRAAGFPEKSKGRAGPGRTNLKTPLSRAGPGRKNFENLDP